MAFPKDFLGHFQLGKRPSPVGDLLVQSMGFGTRLLLKSYGLRPEILHVRQLALLEPERVSPYHL
jgi:hypothetical protein